MLGTYLTLILGVCAAVFAGEQDVLELNDGNFQARLAEVETVLVMFYAPW